MTGRDPGADVFATRFSDALRERGMTLSELSKRLSDDGNPVSLATLSYWRSGGRQPGEGSIAVVDSIEGILRLPVGTLVDLVPLGPRLGTVADPSPEVYGCPVLDGARREIAEAIGAADGMITVVSMARFTVDRAHERGVLEVTNLDRSLRDGTRDVFDLRAVPGGQTDPPRPLEALGLTLAETAHHPSGRMFGYRYELPEPADRGRLIQYRFSVDVPLARPIYGLAFPRPVRELVFQLQFHPESVPSWVEEVEDDREEAAPGRFVPLNGRTSVVISRRHFGPGSVFLRWGSD